MQVMTLEGYVAADPACATGPSGKRRANFRVLETTAFTRADGERVERTTGFNCVCFADAKVCNYIEPWMKKGSRVILAGHVENDTWTDRDGRKHYDLRFVVGDLNIKNKRDAGHDPETGEVIEGGFAARGRFKPGIDSPAPDLDDEIPF